MKVLVYGSGVIGSYLTHVLCSAGNDVTVLARGVWKEHLERHGLRIRHHLQRKDTVDYPRVIGSIEEDDSYDAVFAVMPYDKIGRILDPLAAVNAPLVVLVGNNMSPARMHAYIQEHTVCRKELLFGFQVTAGKRDMEKGFLICERAGAGMMDVGGLHSLPSLAAQNRLSQLFRGTGYQLNFQPDMEAYLICHLAAILPLGYITYANEGTMRSSTAIQRKQTVLASREAYGLLRHLGYPILPLDDDKFYEPGLRGAGMKALYAVMAKTAIGELVACAHCRNAYSEMELLDEAFEKIIARAPGYPMPNWQALKAQMPPVEELKRKYGKA